MNRLILALALLLAPALQGCATAADAAHCRGANGKFIKCPAPPPPTQTCPDGTVILATAICPAPAPAPAPTPAPVPAPIPTGTVAYDTSVGLGVDADGFASLPLRAGAHAYFVNSATGNDANGCTAAQSPATPMHSLTAGIACVANSYEGGLFGDHVLLAEGTRYAEALPWLAFKGGFSPQYPTVIESYDPADPMNAAKYGRGDQRNARPVLTVPQQQASNGIFANIAIRGFDFSPGNNPDQGLTFVGHGSYLLFENNVFRYQGLSYDSSDDTATAPTAQHVIVRNNSLYGMWSTAGRTGGFYAAGVDGPTLEDNVFWHCGWKVGASRDDDMSIGGTTVFSHSYYLQTNTTNATVRRNVSIDGAGDGGIARGDVVMTENLFIDNPAAMGLGGGPNYNTDRPAGVNLQASNNAIIGDADVNSSHPLGWGINTSNGIVGSRVHDNLLLRTRNPAGPDVSGFSNYAAFNQPSYAAYDHNVMFLWVVPAGQVYYASGGAFPAQTHTTYDFNVWDGVAQGTNTNSAAAIFPNAYTAAQLYLVLGYADKDAWIQWAVNHPEAHPARQPRALLFTGYGLAP